MIPGSSRCTSAPIETRSKAPREGIFRPMLIENSSKTVSGFQLQVAG
jgi:hypothetical protein